jgi:hypothetical protein
LPDNFEFTAHVAGISSGVGFVFFPAKLSGDPGAMRG